MAEEPPLPYGWIKEFDDNYQQHYYVDSKAVPPRSIWVHPYEDQQFLREHPDIREKVASRYERPPGPPPPDSRTSSYRGESSSTPSHVPEQGGRSFFGKLKDKAIGSKEEREARRREEQRINEERRQRALEAQRQRMQQQQLLQQQQSFGNRFPQQGYANQGFGGGPPAGYYPPQQAPPRRSGLGGGMALPLLGGLAGGMLLGEALDGGDFGGGDFGGGDFGGGDFGGGGF